MIGDGVNDAPVLGTAQVSIAMGAAAAGYVAPWMAALGMSISSSLVVANALRLNSRARRREKMKPQTNADQATAAVD